MVFRASVPAKFPKPSSAAFSWRKASVLADRLAIVRRRAAIFCRERPRPFPCKACSRRFAALRKCQERFDDRARQRDGIFACLPRSRAAAPSHPSRMSAGRRDRLAPPDQRPVLLVGQHVLAESCAEPGKRLIDLCQRVLIRLRQFGARAHETLPVRSSTRLSSSVRPSVSRFSHRASMPGKQRDIHADLRIMPRHLGRHLALQRLDSRFGMRAGAVPEKRRNPRKLVAGNFERHDRDLECRALRILAIASISAS